MRELYPWQFWISEIPPQVNHRTGRCGIELGPDVPLIVVTGSDDQIAGVLLGFVINLDQSRMVKGTWRAPGKLSSPREDSVEIQLNALGGHFLFIPLTVGSRRIYPHSSAQVSCVFDSDAEIAGSIALANRDGDAYDTRFDAGLFALLGIDEASLQLTWPLAQRIGEFAAPGRRSKNTDEETTQVAITRNTGKQTCARKQGCVDGVEM